MGRAINDALTNLKGQLMKTRVMVVLLAFGLLASACGGSDDSDDGVATLETDDTLVAADEVLADPAEDIDAEQAMLDLAACLRDQGLDIDDPTVDSDGNVQFGGFRRVAADEEGDLPDRDTMESAMAACQSELEGVSLGFGDRGFDQTEMQDTLVEYAACMRENGYDMDDPDLTTFGQPGEGGGGGRPFGDIDPDDPDFITASEACSDILGGLPGAGVGRGPGGGNG